ncbi:MAG: DUF4861 domain-containing protein [Prevotella sp.]|jgi:hypothetical protein|nr:DUF4861 domain-containing protein [Prevotella sp.]
MKQLLSIIMLACAPALYAQQTVSVTVINPTKAERSDEPVVVSLAEYGDIRSAEVICDGKEIPYQLDDLNQDETFDELCFLADLKGREKKNYTVKLFKEGEPRKFTARVFAEMLVRNDKVKEKNKHNNYIESITARGDCAYSYNIQHHHGVDFESELNGIRIYFDKRQTLDLYGKFKKGLELEATQFYTTKEQKAQGYGDDVLWVGNTFGLGAFRGWNGKEPTMIDPVRSRTQRIISYGPLRTIVEVFDRGWKAAEGKPAVNMTIRYTQYAGHRDTDVDVFFNKPVNDYLFSTGVINVKGSEEFSDKKGLRACWGTDWPSGDTINFKRETVGLGICIPMKYIKSEEPANKDNYAFVVGTDDTHLQYRVIYCSANENFGYHSATEWFDFLRKWKKDVADRPVKVIIKD